MRGDELIEILFSEKIAEHQGYPQFMWKTRHQLAGTHAATAFVLGCLANKQSRHTGRASRCVFVTRRLTKAPILRARPAAPGSSVRRRCPAFVYSTALPVVQRIEQVPPKRQIQVQFLSGGQFAVRKMRLRAFFRELPTRLQARGETPQRRLSRVWPQAAVAPASATGIAATKLFAHLSANYPRACNRVGKRINEVLRVFA